MKKQLFSITAIVALTLVGSAFAASGPDYSDSGDRDGFDPVLHADILALRGAPGTATLINNAAFHPITDADILALDGAPGTATLVKDASFHPILDADILAIRGGSRAKAEQ